MRAVGRSANSRWANKRSCMMRNMRCATAEAAAVLDAALGQLKTLRSLARQARRKRQVFERWAR